MDTEIPNTVFDLHGDNAQYKIHECLSPDEDRNCAYGTSLTTALRNVGDHKEYYGVSTGTFGRSGCQVLADGQGINCRGSDCCGRFFSLVSDALPKLKAYVARIDVTRWYSNGDYIACVRSQPCVCLLKSNKSYPMRVTRMEE